MAFLDPPYGKGLGEKALASLHEGGWLTPGALLVIEEAKAAGFVTPESFEELERRAYDDTDFVIFAGRFLTTIKAPSFRDGPKDQTRNLEIPDRRFASSGMTVADL